jgi:hypothetical protein
MKNHQVVSRGGPDGIRARDAQLLGRSVNLVVSYIIVVRPILEKIFIF